jgi:hypothetical protein
MNEHNHTIDALIGLFLALLVALVLAAWQNAPAHTDRPLSPLPPAGDHVVIHQ